MQLRNAANSYIKVNSVSQAHKWGDLPFLTSWLILNVQPSYSEIKQDTQLILDLIACWIYFRKLFYKNFTEMMQEMRKVAVILKK